MDTYKKNSVMTIDSIDDAERRNTITSIAESINIHDSESIIKISSKVGEEISEMNREVLQRIKMKDIPEIDDILPQLNEAFNQVDTKSLTAKKQGFFSRLFGKTLSVDEFTKNFKNAEDVVHGIQDKLESVKFELQKDIYQQSEIGKKNLVAIKNIENIILAMRLKMDDEQKILDNMQLSADASDVVRTQELQEYKDDINSIGNQIYWMEQQRLLAIQTLPILANLKQANQTVVNQIQNTIMYSIPAWEQGIVIAFQAHRQQGAIKIQNAVNSMTSNIVKNNSEMLKKNSEDIEAAIRGGMVDIQVFKEANKNIIEATKKICTAKDNAIEFQNKNIAEYKELAAQLIEAEKTTYRAISDSRG